MSSGISLNVNREREKDWRISTLLSLLFMGLGQIYNRQYIKGALFVCFEIGLLIFLSKPMLHGLWGLYTLGETPQVRVGRRIVEQGDHSIFLMIEGLIMLMLLLLIVFIYILNIRDAYKIGKIHSHGGHVNRFKESLKHVLDHGYAYLLLTPATIFVLFITVLPLLFGILIAFTNFSSPNYIPPKNLVSWVGFQTFSDLFNLKGWKGTFVGVATWTLLWGVLSTLSTFFVGLFFANLINNKYVRFKKMWRAIFILPWAIPGFISILIFRNIFNGQFGPLNKYLGALGIDPIQWFSDPFWAKFALVFVNGWLGFPYWMVMMTGVLANIDQGLYEAAEVDGANAWHKFRKITMPLVMYATAPLLIMSFAYNLNNFNMIYLFTQGGPVNVNYSYAGSTDILISWIYKLTLDQGQFNIASVVSIIIFFVVSIFSIWNFKRTRAFKEEGMIQ